MRTLRLALLYALLLPFTLAQQPTTQIAISGPAPGGITFGSATAPGTGGGATLYYYVVARYPAGLAYPQNGAIVARNTPGQSNLSASNPVVVSWGGVNGATGYDVLRQTTSTAAPSPCSTCAVALNVSGTSLTDVGQSAGAYPPAGFPTAQGVTGVFSIDNTNVSPAALMWNLGRTYRVGMVLGTPSAGQCGVFNSDGSLSGGANCGGGGVIPSTTNVLKGDGAGNAAAVSGTAGNCVHVDGSSGTCGTGSGGITATTVSGLAALTGGGSGTTAYVTDGTNQTDCAVGGGTATNLCTYNATSTKWTVVSVNVGVLNFNTAGHPVDPTGSVDSTAGIQAAINSLPTTGGSISFPTGTYKTSATLTIHDSQGIILVGTGFGAVIQPTTALSGLPIVKFTNCKLCGVQSLRINGTDNTHQPTCAIQSDINAPGTYTATGLTVIGVKIGSDSANNLQKGICWTDSGGVDANNEAGYISNVIVDNTSVACFSVGHSNSELHRFIGGSCSTGPITWQMTGGSFSSTGMVSSATDAIMDFLTGTYLHPTFLDSLLSEGTPILIRTATQSGPGVHLTNVSFAGGNSSTFSIDYNFTGSNFSMVGGRFADGTATKIRFTDYTTAVLFEGLQLGVGVIQYAGQFTSLGNIYTTASPTWTPGSDATKVLRIQIGDKDNVANLIEPTIIGYAGTSGQGFTMPALTTPLINSAADLAFSVTGNMDILTGTLRDWQTAQFWKTVLFYGSPTAGQNTTRVQFRAGSSDISTSKILQGLLNDGTTETWNMSRDGALSALSVATGATPPAVTPGTGGLWAPAEGTAPSAGLPASGVDGCYGDSTAHAIKCSFNNDTALPLSRTVASGTAALGTSAISSGACATVVTATATGTATTDVVLAGFNGDPTAVTGYAPSASGMLTVITYPTANTFNAKVCNNTGSSVTPGAITLNWRISR